VPLYPVFVVNHTGVCGTGVEPLTAGCHHAPLATRPLACSFCFFSVKTAFSRRFLPCTRPVVQSDSPVAVFDAKTEVFANAFSGLEYYFCGFNN
jgi:hypothetical protein